MPNAPRPTSGDPATTLTETPDTRLRLVPSGECPDRDLVARIQCGDPEAFERVFRTYYASLCTVVRGYVHSREIAEELVQDLLLTLWRLRGQLEVQHSLRVYLFSAARHRALNALRRVRREVAWARDEIATAQVSPRRADGDERVASQELTAAVDAAVATLPERRRLAFQLTQLAGLSHAQAASVMGIAPRTVAIHLGLARQDLRAQLSALVHP